MKRGAGGSYIEITKSLQVCMGHRLVNHTGKCAYLHGHTYSYELTMHALRLDDLGMVADYSVLKTLLEETAGVWDHGFMLYEQDPIVQKVKRVLEARQGPKWPGDWQHQVELELATTLFAPALPPDVGDEGGNNRIFVSHFNPTTENLVLEVARRVETHPILAYMDSVQVVAVTAWESPSSNARVEL